MHMMYIVHCMMSTTIKGIINKRLKVTALVESELTLNPNSGAEGKAHAFRGAAAAAAVLASTRRLGVMIVKNSPPQKKRKLCIDKSNRGSI